eukprot:14138643-Alexandrium_andersonii.AAC.1
MIPPGWPRLAGGWLAVGRRLAGRWPVVTPIASKSAGQFDRLINRQNQSIDRQIVRSIDRKIDGIDQ